MPRRIIAFVVLAVAMAALFVRLGFWQMGKYRDRRARNAGIMARLERAEVPYAQTKGDSAAAYRRVSLAGVIDTLNEFVVTGRSRNGSPGVHIITPVRVAGDSAVLVNRGWVYAPDAATVDLARWRERRGEFHGYTLAVPEESNAAPAPGRAIRQFARDRFRVIMPYVVAGTYVVAQDTGAVDSIPARLPLPALDKGPYLSYTIQWFAFAIIALCGAVIVAKRSLPRA